MNNGFIELRDVQSLDDFLKQSNGNLVVILKHSDTCGISSRAYIELTNLGRPVGLVRVQTAREVSNEITARFGIEHETPQVLVICDSKVVWNTSHGGVRNETVGAALKTLARNGIE